MHVPFGQFKKGFVTEQWSIKAVDCLIQMVSNTGLIVF